MLRNLHSRSEAEADTEVVAVVVSMEVEAEAASTVVADFMEAVAGVMAAEHIAAGRRVARLEAWVRMDAAAAVMRRVDTAAERMAVDVPTVRTVAAVRMAHTAEHVRMG